MITCWIRVFHSLYKVGRNRSVGIKGFNNSKKATPSGAQPDAIGIYFWFSRPMPNQLSLTGMSYLGDL